MLDARIQPLLHPARQHRVAQHEQGGALYVVHVHPAALALEGSKFGNQHAGQARHALLVAPGGVLVARCNDPHDDVLRSADGGDADNFFAELSRRATIGQQRGERGIQLAVGQCGFQRNAHGGKRGRAGAAQRLCCVAQKLQVGVIGADEFIGGSESSERGIEVEKLQHRRFHHALSVGQRELNPLVQCHRQRFFALVSAML